MQGRGLPWGQKQQNAAGSGPASPSVARRRQERMIATDSASAILRRPSHRGESRAFGHDAQRAVGSDEVYRLHALVAFDGTQELPEKDGPAGPRGRDGQILRWMIRQEASGQGT